MAFPLTSIRERSDLRSFSPNTCGSAQTRFCPEMTQYGRYGWVAESITVQSQCTFLPDTADGSP